MKVLGALIGATLIAGSAAAQIVPLGAPIIAQPKTKAAPPPSSSLDQSGRQRAARPLGSNYSPYSIQPLGSVTAGASSSVAADAPVASGVVTNPDVALSSNVRKPAKAATGQQSDLQKLAPKAPERTDMPQADAASKPPR